MANTIFAAAMVAVVATGQACQITSDTHTWDLSSLTTDLFLPYRAHVQSPSTDNLIWNYCGYFYNSSSVAWSEENYVSVASEPIVGVQNMRDPQGSTTGVQFSQYSRDYSVCKQDETGERLWQVTTFLTCDENITEFSFQPQKETGPEYVQPSVSQTARYLAEGVATVVLKDDCEYQISMAHAAGCPTPTPIERFESLFQVNEETGRVEFKDMPELPKISFNDVDDEKIMEWATGKQAETDAWNQEWVAAYEAYEQAIAAPWNKLVSEAESLIVSGSLADLKTVDEVISFVASNTFVDGVALSEVLPEYEEFIQEMYSRHEQMSTELSSALDNIRFPLLAMHVVMQESLEYVQAEPTPAEQAYEEFVSKLGEAVISYGYNPEVVDAWFQETGSSWEELERKQKQEKAAKAQQDINQAKDYAMNILDNAWTDLQAKQVENQAALDEAVGAKISETKAMLEEKSQEARSAVDEWLQANSNNSVAEPVAEDSVMLASHGAEQSNSSAYSFAAFSAIALAAAGVYLYGKKNEVKVTANKEDLLSTVDDEFQQC